jgi:hypothetical protein
VKLSVVVAIVDGGDALAECLARLGGGGSSGSLEVIVPWDERCDVKRARESSPHARFLEIRGPQRRAGADSLLALHERIDRRRAAGLAAAQHEIVALIEDRVVPRAGWARQLVLAHAAHPEAAAVGGAVACGAPRGLARAVCACDYGRYGPPFPPGPALSLSDVNVSYKRGALEATRAIWADRYHESELHRELRARGALLWATPDAVVETQRQGLTLIGLLRERVAFGRVFGWTRARRASIGRRLAWLALAPVLPPLLTARRLAEAARSGSLDGGFVAALPAILLLSCAWVAGEALAVVTRRA